MALPVPDTWSISGVITLPEGGFFSSGKVKAFDLYTGTEIQLGETGISSDGVYSLLFSKANFQNGNGNREYPVMQVRVYDYQDRVLWRSLIISIDNNAQVLNIVLENSSSSSEIWKVVGNVRYSISTPLIAGTVHVFDSVGNNEYELGSATLSSAGYYEVSYTKAAFQRGDLNRNGPNLVIRAYDRDGSNVATTSLGRVAGSYETVIVQIPAGEVQYDGNYYVYGTVVNKSKRPLSGVPVRAYCWDFQVKSVGEEEKGEFVKILLNKNDELVYTDSHGSYTVAYDPNLLPRQIVDSTTESGKDKVSLFAEIGFEKKFKNEDGEEQTEIRWFSSTLVFKGQKKQEINFTVNEFSNVFLSEFEDLENLLSIYREAVLSEGREEDPEALPTDLDRITQFISHITKFPLVVGRESLKNEQVLAYFTAYQFFFRLVKSLELDTTVYDGEIYAQFLYALARKGIATLASLINAKPTEIQSILLGSISDRVISAKLIVQNFMDLWQKTQQSKELAEVSEDSFSFYHVLILWMKGELNVDEESKKIILPTLEGNEQTLLNSLLSRYYEAASNEREFLKLVTPTGDVADLLSQDQSNKLEFVLDLRDFSSNYPDFVVESYKYCLGHSPTITSLEGMLALTLENWETLVTNVSTRYKAWSGESHFAFPVTYPGSNATEQIKVYAAKLFKAIVAWFPQEEVAGSLAALVEESPDWKPVGETLQEEEWAEFDLDSTNLDEFLASNPSLVVSAEIQNKIRILQRLYRLTTDVKAVYYLASNGFESAYQIAQMQENAFVAEHCMNLKTMAKARQIHRLAVHYTTESALEIGKYHTNLNEQDNTLIPVSRGIKVSSLKTASVVTATANATVTNVAAPRIPLRTVANWKNLFGVLNQNAAAQGQSILSPSAYFVDLLDFLKEGRGYKLLKTRRSDLWKIELSAANADTAMPTIDLAIELLECLAARANLSTLTYQTTWSAAELRAESEYWNALPAAYLNLAQSVFPAILPCNFSREEALLLLNNVRLSFRDLACITENSLSRRHLILDYSLETILNRTTSVTVPVWELWGLMESGNSILCPDKATTASGTWLDVLAKVPVFLDRSGLTMDELSTLIKMSSFADYEITIVATNESYQLADIYGFSLVNLSEGFARNVARFIRLRRLLGWSMEALDAAWALSLDELDVVQDLCKATGASVMDVLSWQLPMTDSYFQSIFSMDTTFIVDAEKTVAEQFVEYRDKLISVSNIYLKASKSDIALIIDLEGSFNTVKNDMRADLEKIRRVYFFVKCLGCSLRNYFLFAKWFHFVPVAQWTWIFCRETLDTVGEIQGSSLPEDILIALAISPSATLSEEAATYILELQEVASVVNEANKATLLGITNNSSSKEEWIVALFATINEPLSIEQLSFLDQEILIPEEKVVMRDWLLDLCGDFFTTQITAVVNAGNVEERQTGLSNLLDSWYRRSQMQAELLKQLATHFGVDEDICNALLDEYLLSVDGLSSAWNDWVNILSADKTSSAATYIRLQKMVTVLQYTKIQDVENLAQLNSFTFSWNDFPIQSLAIATDEKVWDWKNYPVNLVWDNVIFTPFSNVLPLLRTFYVSDQMGYSNWSYTLLKNRTEVQAKLDLSNAELDPLLVASGLPLGETLPLTVLEPWVKFCRLLKLYKKTYTKPATLAALLNPVFTEAEFNAYLVNVAKLRQNIKEHMSVTDWREFIQPVSDKLRQAKRDALIAYICWASQSNNEAFEDYYPQEFFDSNDLYSYYLLDVQMEPDMTVSRIRQALNSVQLFVERALMGLEGTYALNEKQMWHWEWMKNYRVWEANRKVFLYPENWIETDLRDDKSPFFKELENRLQETGDDPDALDDALAEYLEKMRDTSSLEIVGACKEDGGGAGVLYTLHIVGRTRGEPHQYYYRKYWAKALYSGEWHPWERLDLDIQGEIVLPALLNQRLYLIWPQFQLTKEENGSNSTGPTEMKSRVEVRLSWASYNGQKWTGTKTSKMALFDISSNAADHRLDPGEKIDDRYHFQSVNASSDFLEIKMFRTEFAYTSEIVTGTTQAADETVVHWSREDRTYDKNVQMIREFGSFHIWTDGRDEAYNAEITNLGYVSDYPPTRSRLEHNVWVEMENFTCGAKNLEYPKGNVLFRFSPGIRRILPVNFAFYTGESLPFFYMDNQRTYFVQEVPCDGDNTKKSYKFELLSHPLVGEFYKRYRDGGNKWLFTRETQALPVADSYYYSYSYYNYYFSIYLGYYIAGDWQAWDLGQSLFSYAYQPVSGIIAKPYPVPMIDFSWGNPNSIYNWELFFHVPMLLAGKMFQEQRYEEAMAWYQQVFDPRITLSDYEETKRWSRVLPKGARFWKFLPFFANKDADDSILETLGHPTTSDLLPDHTALQSLIDKWKDDPFNPHLIARYRFAAYQKNVVMKYLDNLIAWADQLFTQDTMESINEAIQLYVLAAEILGPRSAEASDMAIPEAMTVEQFQTRKEQSLGNIFVEIEDDMIKTRTQARVTPQRPVSAKTQQLIQLSSSMFYFSVPRNEKVREYWNTVADRLYKIRNSLNIEGVKRVLALYEPPIDPALLVKARAAGLSIQSVLADASTPVPYYRFQTMLQKSVEITRDLQSLGSSFLAALEKKDAEALALMRTSHEQELLKLSQSVRELQLKELETQLEALEKSRNTVQIRYEFYRDIIKCSDLESLHLKTLIAMGKLQDSAEKRKLAASVAALLPEMSIGVVGNCWGGPQFTMQMGGSKIAQYIGLGAEALQISANNKRNEAERLQLQAGYARRWEDWKLQEKLASEELANIDKQILANQIRIQIAEKEQGNLERQIEQVEEIYEFMSSRFTNKDLYSWMVTELGKLYSAMFKLTLKLAKRTEKCYQFEFGLLTGETSFIKTSYWDGLRKGLLAGDKLLADLRTMDAAYLEKNRRDMELTRPVSLAMLNPVALRNLQKEGKCTFNVPEVLFDMDFPGQYFRRIKAVRLEIHCNAGPNVTVSAKLTLKKHTLRLSAINATDAKNRDSLENRIGITTMATSQAQGDGGMFDFSFKDERYLPFEGAGVEGEWELQLPAAFRQFDYDSIADVLLQISYTARNGDVSDAKNAIANAWNSYKTTDNVSGLVRELRLSRDFYENLLQLRAGKETTIVLTPECFPAFAKGGNITNISLIARSEESGKYVVATNTGRSLALASTNGEWGGSSSVFSETQGLPYSLTLAPSSDANTVTLTTLDGLQDLIIQCNYTIEA